MVEENKTTEEEQLVAAEEGATEVDESAVDASQAVSESAAGESEVAEESGSVDEGSEVSEEVAAEEGADAEEAEEEEVELSPEELEFSDDEIVTDEDEGDQWGGDDALPIEEFVEEVVEASDELEMNWYILKVQVNREKSICEALMRRVKQAGMDSFFGDILVPTEDVREFTKSGKQRIVKRKLYPGYIVVRMAINDDTWFLVRETPGIGDFTGAVGKPASLTQQEIDRIIATTRPPEDDEEAEETIKTSIRHKVGDRVRVKEGYFQNYEGEVSKIDERNGRIEVMINIFGRPNPVELDHWQVEDI